MEDGIDFTTRVSSSLGKETSEEFSDEEVASESMMSLVVGGTKVT